MQAMCSADCKGYLQMVFGAFGSMLSQMSSQMPQGSGSSAPAGLSNTMTDMVSCMCDQPNFAALMPGGSGSSAPPSMDVIKSFCSTASCASIIPALSQGQQNCDGIQKVIKMFRTKVTMTLAGDVSDHQAKLETYRKKFASAFGVAKEMVSITLASGSTVMTVTITSSTDLSATVSSKLGTSSKADDLLGCTGCNTVAPQLETTEETVGGDDGLSGGAIAGIVIGSVVGACLLLGLLYFLMKPKPAAKDVSIAMEGGEKGFNRA